MTQRIDYNEVAPEGQSIAMFYSVDYLQNLSS